MSQDQVNAFFLEGKKSCFAAGGGFGEFIVEHYDLLKDADIGFLYGCLECYGPRYRVWNRLGFDITNKRQRLCCTSGCGKNLSFLEADIALNLGVTFLNGYRCMACGNFSDEETAVCRDCHTKNTPAVYRGFYQVSRFWGCIGCNSRGVFTDLRHSKHLREACICGNVYIPLGSIHESANVVRVWW